MWFAPMLKLRDKLSRKRNVLLEDEEKPFLEHLDDLRKMLMRIVMTLLVSITLCFVFNKWFFEVIQYPMARAGLASAQERNLPEGLVLEQWKQIHTAARGASVLEGAGRELFLTKSISDPKLRPYAEAMLIYHTADMLPVDQQSGYLEEASKLLPAALQAPTLEAGRAILKVRPQSSLEALRPVIETEAFAPAETFMLSMKLSMFAGIIVSFPLLFYFILEFVLPGLSSRERKLLWPALSIGFGLFLLGVFFAYYFVIPNALEFFHEYSRDLGIRDGWRIGNYISFVTSFCLIFGVSFELPVIVMILVKLELLTSATMRRTRSWAIVIITVASAILTPTGDIFTLSLLAGPMIIMYEACIWLAVAHERKLARVEAEEAKQDMARRAALVGVATVAAARPGSTEAADSSKAAMTDATENHPDDVYPSDDSSWHDHDAHHHDYHSHHGDGSEPSSQHWDGHPHHPDPDKPSPDEEYEQYMREHAHLFPPAQTHPENFPVTDEPADPGAPELETGRVSESSDSTPTDTAAVPESGPPAAPEVETIAARDSEKNELRPLTEADSVPTPEEPSASSSTDKTSSLTPFPADPAPPPDGEQGNR